MECFFCKGQLVSILGFVDHTVSFAKAAIDSMQSVAMFLNVLFTKTGEGLAHPGTSDVVKREIGHTKGRG